MTFRRASVLIASLLLAVSACARHDAPKVVADDATLPSPASMLPPVKSGAPLTPARFTITIGPKSLLLDGAVIAARAADSTHGFDVQYKRNGANDLYLVPLAAAIDRARAGKDAGAGGDSARMEIAPDVTYRELVEVAFTLGQNEVSSYRIVAPSAGGLVPQGALAEIAIFPPRVHGLAPSTMPTLGLTMILVHDGVSLKARGGNIAPGCTDVGPGLTFDIGDAGGVYPFAAIAACLTRLKAAAPEFSSETSAVFSANPEVRFRDVLVAIDALRGEHRDLFPDVQLGVAR